jgi:nucleoside-diphosphate-sugar epimerase
MAKILIVGCGAIGRALGNLLTLAGHEVIGLKRNPPSPNPDQFSYVAGDISSAEGLANLPTGIDFLYFIVAPDRRDDNSYHAIYHTGITNLISKLQEKAACPSWFFISSTSVYGQTQGEWVDEQSPALGSSANSLQIVAAEQKITALNPANVIVRFSGIYGPGREYLMNRAKQSPQIQLTPPYYTNRIHQDDCVGLLVFLLEQHLSGVNLASCYLASDNNPAPLWEVVNWLATQLSCPPPQAVTSSENVDMNKRCNNTRIKSLGYSFHHPDYQSGYLDIIRKTQ